mmetsp:Transcript_95513/g.179743  ORF Transcript_95513/g.179743 Transcript_95513/m.179743 type:complete len:295 (-) Transcript_95513:34-918(-)
MGCIENAKHWLARHLCCCCTDPLDKANRAVQAEFPRRTTHFLRIATDPEAKKGQSWELTADNVLMIDYNENGTALGENKLMTTNVKTELDLKKSRRWKVMGGADKAAVKAKFIARKAQKWGINWAGQIVCNGSVMYLPGFKTYDPAGETGHPHNSEIVGVSCAASLNEIFGVMLHAVVLGCDHVQLEELADKFRLEIMKQYHGREELFSWLVRQLHEAMTSEILKVTPYPTHLQEAIRSGVLDVSDKSHEHSGEYLSSWKDDAPRRPRQYFAAFDKMASAQTAESSESRRWSLV